jgi:tRNA-specific 2-thiouridylase
MQPATATLVVGDEAGLAVPGLVGRDVNWISIPPPQGELRASVKIRSRAAPASATVRPLPGGKVEVRFDEPQRAVTPGQAAVFYDDEVCLGGAWIESSALEHGALAG